MESDEKAFLNDGRGLIKKPGVGAAKVQQLADKKWVSQKVDEGL